MPGGFVGEVLSEGDKKDVLAAKLRYYQGHEHNRCVLFVRQDHIGAVQYNRQPGREWRRRSLARPSSALNMPDIGAIGRLGDLYEGTPLNPFAKVTAWGQTRRV
jgi:hypothetical protein